MAEDLKFEEYKLHLERAQKLSERRQTTTQTYLTISTAIFGAISFLIKDSGLHHWALAGVVLPLFSVGIIACSIWLQIMKRIEKFLNWQYQCLREMENDLPDSYEMLIKENDQFYAPAKAGKKFMSFSLQEAWLPRLLIILFGLYAVGMILAAAFGWL